MHAHILDTVLILLASSVVAVILFRRLHLPPVLAYLLVGVVVGPYGLHWVDHTGETHFLAELGVVFLLFTVGLEFSLAQLMAMRREVLGLGGLQVLSTVLVVAVVAWLAGLGPAPALILGGALAMSSTALVTRELTERTELYSAHGRLAVAILLFQDVAVVPFLILASALTEEGSGSAGLALFATLAKGVLAVGSMFLVGRWLLRPVFRLTATYRSAELLTLLALLVALSAAWLTQLAGLSLALGAFVAGMILGETEFRHQVEADVRPFRDVLLGLFFVMIGMMLDLNVLAVSLTWVALFGVGLIGFKALSIAGLSRLFGAQQETSMRVGLLLAQGGEFGLALLVLALGVAGLADGLAQMVLASIVLTMALSPLIIREAGRVAAWLSPPVQAPAPGAQADEGSRAVPSGAHALICGYGQTGQHLARLLELQGVGCLALDLDPTRVQEARSAGEPVHYGDAGRADVLRAAGLGTARAVVISQRDRPSALRILHQVRHLREDVPVLVRVHDETGLDEMQAAGATVVIPDAVESAMTLGEHLLLMMGSPASVTARQIKAIRNSQYRLLRGHFPGIETPSPDDSDAEVWHEHLDAVTVPPKAFAVGRTLKDLALDRLDVQVSLLRRGRDRIHRPATSFRVDPGDTLVLYGAPQDLARAEERLLSGAAPPSRTAT